MLNIYGLSLPLRAPASPLPWSVRSFVHCYFPSLLLPCPLLWQYSLFTFLVSVVLWICALSEDLELLWERMCDVCLLGLGLPHSANLFWFHSFTCKVPYFIFLYSRIVLHISMYHIFIIYSLTEDHLGCFCFHFLVIVNRAEMNWVICGAWCQVLWAYDKEWYT